MTEQEYIRTTNRVNISRALNALRDVTPGSMFGVAEDDLKRVTVELACAEQRLFKLIEVEEDT